LKYLLVAVLVAANAFFVAAEFALVTARRTRIRELAVGGDRRARSVEIAQKNLDRSISGTQLGITLASLGLGWVGEPVFARSLESLFQALPAPWNAILTHGAAAAVALAGLTFLHIVLGELAPKSLALMRPESVSRAVAGPLNLFNTISWPAIEVLNRSAALVLRAFGASDVGAHERVHSPDEIQMLLHQSLLEGMVEDDEEAMIHGVFELTHTVAREVMTPRPDIVGLPEDATLDEALDVAARSGFSRFPVYSDSLDQIIGVLLVKDLLGWILDRTREDFTLAKVVREPLFVPDTKPVDDLLAELRWQKMHMAIVVDEFGGTDGIVTLEDLLEEIVGDIFDEHDIPEADFIEQPDGRVLVDGRADMDDLIEEYGLPKVQQECDTVAGFVIGRLGRIPKPGERVRIGEAEIEVLEIQEHRVTRLALHQASTKGAADGQADGGSDATGGEEHG